MGIDTAIHSSPLRRRLRRLSRSERREEATAFIDQFHREQELSERERLARRLEVVRSLDREDHYDHTPEELAFGARVAWRNHSRCIGRLLWRSLEVFDCRSIRSPEGIAARMADHLRESIGPGGAIRSIISIFPPMRGNSSSGGGPCVIESRQVVQYAGYRLPGGGVLGDPITVEATANAIALGWLPPATRSAFDVLPLLIRDERERRSFHLLPEATIREVAIEHPVHSGLADLGLRWYAVPCVSSMILTIGGIEYPCAPFNGHYMATEIASRNFGDVRRYDLLPAVRERLGLEAGSPYDPLWRDRCLLELNRAVLHSFAKAGVTIVDHHTASEQFMLFMQRESAEGRTASADWGWIVPPQASSACPVFHLKMADRHLVPNYYDSRATDGANLGVNYDDQSRCPFRRAVDRVRRRWRLWRRSRY
jgi:nitric-oxide synthase